MRSRRGRWERRGLGQRVHLRYTRRRIVDVLHVLERESPRRRLAAHRAAAVELRRDHAVADRERAGVEETVTTPRRAIWPRECGRGTVRHARSAPTSPRSPRTCTRAGGRRRRRDRERSCGDRPSCDASTAAAWVPQRARVSPPRSSGRHAVHGSGRAMRLRSMGRLRVRSRLHVRAHGRHGRARLVAKAAAERCQFGHGPGSYGPAAEPRAAASTGVARARK